MTDGVHEMRVALTVKDFDAALRLYREGLGLEVTEAFENSPDGRVVILPAGAATIELLNGPQADFVDEVETGSVVGASFRLALQVDDVEATGKRLQNLGARVIHQPVITPWGDRNMRLKTPDGVQITLFQSPEGEGEQL
jgi:catechol 2,3-dioxygenase-like lactoylglutathione lyase family enzyme